eukprot:916819_1
MDNLNKIVTIAYISIQVTIALFVSVFGAVYVRRSIAARAKSFKEARIQANTKLDDDQKDPSHNPSFDKQIRKECPSTKTDPDDNDERKDAGNNPPSDADTTIAMDIEEKTAVDVKQKGFCEIWVRVVWKMRSVYSSLAVHSFDILTDVLVIVQWMKTPNKPGDHINPQAMAYSAIGVMIFCRVLSAFAIYIKERRVMRSVLQLFDLLIFQEIYESHHKIVSQCTRKSIKSRKNIIESRKYDPIDSTLSFKYVRSMEAIFESVPQAVIQLVYMMRVSQVGTDQIIFYMSIVQSIVSMANSILKNDYTRVMQDDKWTNYKQGCPPTFAFLKHALCRVSEVIYRIGLLALLWTVCEGMAFAVLIGVELAFICWRVNEMVYHDRISFNADTMLLAISSFVVIPSEEVYGMGYPRHNTFGSDIVTYSCDNSRSSMECTCRCMGVFFWKSLLVYGCCIRLSINIAFM